MKHDAPAERRIIPFFNLLGTYRKVNDSKGIKVKSFFYFVSQKGSHIKLRKIIGTKTTTTIVPNHKELSPGTLKGVLELAEINRPTA